MKLILIVKSGEGAPSDWRLRLLNNLNEFLEAQQIEDFSITLVGSDPCVVSMIEPEVSAEKGAPK